MDALNAAGVEGVDLETAMDVMSNTNTTEMELPEDVVFDCGSNPDGLVCQCNCLIFALQETLPFGSILANLNFVCIPGQIIDPNEQINVIDAVMETAGDFIFGDRPVIAPIIDILPDPISDAIGNFFGAYFFCRRHLQEGDVPVQENLSLDQRLQVIKATEHLGAKPDATFSFTNDLISKKSCDALVQYTEESLQHDIDAGVDLEAKQAAEDSHESWTPFEGGYENQYSKNLSADDLIAIIGKDETMNIINYFEETLGIMSIDHVYLARTFQPDDGEELFTPWHIDDYAAVEITLNNDYEGGHVLHLNAAGVHKVDSRPGSAIAHKSDIVHGITPINKGAKKYMLVLKHYLDDKERKVKLSKEMVDVAESTM